jgi:hypothetical protein
MQTATPSRSWAAAAVIVLLLIGSRAATLPERAVPLAQAQQPAGALALTLPNKANSLKYGGDGMSSAMSGAA